MRFKLRDSYGLTDLSYFAIIAGSIMFVIVGLLVIYHFWWAHNCGYPNHLVYTGWSNKWTGKFYVKTDNYVCVPN
jgi:hypothetical protein